MFWKFLELSDVGDIIAMKIESSKLRVILKIIVNSLQVVMG